MPGAQCWSVRQLLPAMQWLPVSLVAPAYAPPAPQPAPCCCRPPALCLQLQQEMAEAKRQLRGLGLEALEQRGAAGARLDRAARQVQMVSRCGRDWGPLVHCKLPWASCGGPAAYLYKATELRRCACVFPACRWGSPASQVPVVRFLNGRELPLGPVTFSAELAGVGVCSRVQVPLRCAWAITIHKCQASGGIARSPVAGRRVAVLCCMPGACGRRQQQLVEEDGCTPAHVH